jgi:hypothetical protein
MLDARRLQKPPESAVSELGTVRGIRTINQAALDLDRTASDVMEEAAKQWLERRKHKK